MTSGTRISDNLTLKWLGIDAYQESILFIRSDSPISTAEGFEARSRVIVKHANASLVATLNFVDSDILGPNQVSLSEVAWKKLGAKEGDRVGLFHTEIHDSVRFLRSKLFGHALDRNAFDAILKDIVSGYYSDVHLASFITACSGDRLNPDEMLSLTEAMIHSGNILKWPEPIVMDKHCVGGLPGNRTTLLVVPIIAAFGLTMPKSSSRAITSPAGTADTMEVFTRVDLSPKEMREVVEKAGGCIVWGGSADLSPADDIIIRVERVLDLDSEGQLVASVLSKKAAAGSNHVLIDMPVGPTAKVRSKEDALRLTQRLMYVGERLGMKIAVHQSDGNQPVGRGIGPCLEARDVLAVLKGDRTAPEDLKNRALDLAGILIEMSGRVAQGEGRTQAARILAGGVALSKFMEICHTQGGFKEPWTAPLQYTVAAKNSGSVAFIDNRRLAQVAKLAGAPRAKSAGVDLLTPLDRKVEKGQPLFVIHAETKGELDYAIQYVSAQQNIVAIA